MTGHPAAPAVPRPAWRSSDAEFEATSGELPTLHTPRLVLRPFVPGDAADVERLAGVREVADTTLSIPHPYPAGSATDWIARQGAAWQQNSALSLAITVRDTGELAGAISLRVAREHEHAELGYWVARHAWGRGFATEAALAVLAFAFDDLRLHRVFAHHFVRNPASGRVLEKVGMKREGLHRHAFRRWDSFEDVAVYGILAPEWYALRDRPAAPEAD